MRGQSLAACGTLCLFFYVRHVGDLHTRLDPIDSLTTPATEEAVHAPQRQEDRMQPITVLTVFC